MIEVRIRHEDDVKAIPLCYWDPTDLDGIVPMIANQGVRLGNGEQFAGTANFTTEIVVEDGAAFLEVTIVDQS